MAKFKVTGTYSGKLRSAEIDANSEDEAILQVTQKFIGFIVQEVVVLNSPKIAGSTDDLPSSSYRQPARKATSMPIVGAIAAMYPKTNKGESSAQGFVNTCDQFIGLIRLLGWIVVILYSFILIGSGVSNPYNGFLDILLGLVVIAVFLVIAFAVIEFQVLFLRFMRECVEQLDKIRESRKTDS